MSGELNLYSGYTFLSGLMQVKVCIRTTSKKKVSEILNLSYKYVQDYFSESLNEEQLIATKDNDNIPFFQKVNEYQGWKTLEEIMK